MSSSGNVAETASAKETRTTRTRPALGEALLSLLEEKTFEQVTIRQLTARAGISYATFFRHYADKEALLKDQVTIQIKQLLTMTLPLLYTADSRSSAKALFAYVEEHRSLWKTLLTGGAAGMLKDEFISQAQELAAQSEDNCRIPNDLRVAVPVASALEVLAWWLKQESPPPVESMSEFLELLVIKPSMAI